MRTLIESILLAAIVLLSTSDIVNAANPADVTAFHRPMAGEFYKFASDAGPWCAFASYPVTGDSAVTYLHWQNAKVQEEQFMLITSPSKSLDLAVVGELWNKDSTFARSEVGIDYHVGGWAIGAIVPLRHSEPIKLGPRFRLGPVNTYFSFAHGSKPGFGLAGTVNGVRCDAAYVGQSWFLRAWRPCGELSPELRLRFRGKDAFIGFGIGFSPR